MNKCDICYRFGELETITVEIKKHKECDVNGLFNTVNVEVKANPKVTLDLPRNEIKEESYPFIDGVCVVPMNDQGGTITFRVEPHKYTWFERLFGITYGKQSSR